MNPPEIDSEAYPPCVGQFTPIRMIEDKEIIKRFEHIPCQAGDMVFWDYRIPHSNSYKNTASTREAVYIGLLPNIELNRSYVKEQLDMFQQGIVPTDQWHSHSKIQKCGFAFSSLGKKLMGIDKWS
jgi:ectoine hydroxylase-related dioxygenase (phytanoyl-CoA dioxygenase family)